MTKLFYHLLSKVKPLIIVILSHPKKKEEFCILTRYDIQRKINDLHVSFSKFTDNSSYNSPTFFLKFIRKFSFGSIKYPHVNNIMM